MKMKHRAFVAALAFGCYSLAWAEPAPTEGKKPSDRPAHNTHQGHGAQQGRDIKQIMLENAEGATITLWKPDLTTAPLAAEHGHISLRPTGMDNYHAIVAAQDWDGLKETVIRYEYMRGKPSGHSPAELTAAVKADFEIVPDPLPREHARYMTGRPAAFLVRYRGTPLSGIPVTLTTSNGSTLQDATDAEGLVRFKLPDDFPVVKPGRENNRPAEMQVRSEYQADNQSYNTVLSAQYHVNPRHWQSFEAGLLIAAVGAVVGGITGRRILAAGGKPAKQR